MTALVDFAWLWLSCLVLLAQKKKTRPLDPNGFKMRSFDDTLWSECRISEVAMKWMQNNWGFVLLPSSSAHQRRVGVACVLILHVGCKLQAADTTQTCMVSASVLCCAAMCNLDSIDSLTDFARSLAHVSKKTCQCYLIMLVLGRFSKSPWVVVAMWTTKWVEVN